jgi:hypothetical protein
MPSLANSKYSTWTLANSLGISRGIKRSNKMTPKEALNILWEKDKLEAWNFINDLVAKAEPIKIDISIGYDEYMKQRKGENKYGKN